GVASNPSPDVGAKLRDLRAKVKFHRASLTANRSLLQPATRVPTGRGHPAFSPGIRLDPRIRF
ncbi:MAG TPA: hypothetical protein VEV61_03235, partial [Streptosporangiaceae bacterium]|nr:hypothetical protein [Streptosporangiaceae bacterium]